MERLEIKLASDDFDAKTGEFRGYGSVFGGIDSYGDRIEKGAFKATLREWEDRGKFPPMLLQHGGFGVNAMDMVPVGQWTEMEENSKGLKVAGRLFAMGTERGQYIYEGLKTGALDGLSIGYRARKFVNGTKPNEPRRTLTDIDLVELSIVTIPADDKARVGAVKTIRQFEDFLRDVGGFGAAAAKAIAARGFKAADPRDEDGADVVALLRRNIDTLKI